ncbi:helix-turn-helix domain-containing protein [Desulfoplanes sp. PS50]|jgi:DNA-binding Xre family transcriptional regulator
MKSNLERIMKDKNMTIRALEQLSEVNNVTILKARKDVEISRCTLATLEKLAMALDVSVHDLFDDGHHHRLAPQMETQPSTRIDELAKRIDKIESKLQHLPS